MPRPTSAMLALAALAGLATAGGAQARNYLIIVADDLGVDKVTSYAHDYDGIYDTDGDGVPDNYAPQFLPNTATVDDLAAHGLRFTRAWAEPVCSPSRTTLHTGQHPFRHGTGTALGAGAAGFDPAAFTTLADFASTNGYATGAFGKWHMGTEDAAGATGIPGSPFTDEPHPGLTGFDRFYGALDGDIADYNSWIRVEWRGGAGQGTVRNPETMEATERTATKAGNWIGSQTGDWLAVVNFHAPHAPTAADIWAYGDVDPACVRTPALAACLTAGTCADEERAVYQGLAECMDIHTENLLASIDPAVLEDTLIVFIGDNGTPDDVLEDLFWDADGDGSFDGHGKGTAYENGLRVPFVVTDGYDWVHGGGGGLITSPGRDVAFGVHVADIYETIHLDMTGTTSAVADSFDFSACFTSTAPYCGMSRNYGYSERFSGGLGSDEFGSVRYGNDKLIARWNAASACLDATYYDTAADPMETTPVALAAARANRLKNGFTALHSGTGSWGDGLTFCP